jgi:spore coat protein U-like protein
MSKLARPLISKKRLGLAVMALGAMQGVAAGPAHAGGLGSGTLTASGTITAACYLSDSTMSFGVFGGITDLAGDTAAPTGSSPVGWNCTNGTTGTFAALADTVTISAGTLGSLVAGISNISAGGAGASSSPATLAGTGTSANTTLYGSLTVPTTAKAGTYSGTLGLTITY